MGSEIKIQEFSDVFHDERWPLFDKGRAKQLSQHVPKLGILSITSCHQAIPRDTRELDEDCARAAAGLIFNNPKTCEEYSAWLFVAHSAWRGTTAVILKKKLWKSLPTEWPLSMLELGPELMFESVQGIRFAGLAALKPATLSAAVQVMRRHPASALLICGKWKPTNEEAVRFIFHSAFPIERDVEQSSIDWMTLSLYMCPLGAMLGRITGSYDERCSSMDIIISSDKLALFQSL